MCFNNHIHSNARGISLKIPFRSVAIEFFFPFVPWFCGLVRIISFFFFSPIFYPLCKIPLFGINWNSIVHWRSLIRSITFFSVLCPAKIRFNPKECCSIQRCLETIFAVKTQKKKFDSKEKATRHCFKIDRERERER